ncbi:hypothetical protein L7F22_062506 [Adiantum nelumboides]|nr:hypothetical protein [Adiantum nelumboides]
MDSPNNVTEAAPVINFSVSSIISTSLVALIGALLLVKFVQRLRVKLPPGPFAWPIVGNFLQLRTGLTPQTLAVVAKKYGDVCLLQMGQRKVLVISSPDMAKDILQTQGVEFGSRARNLVFDMTTGHGQDLVFADYGEHWRKMRRIATLPFFTNKVVQQSRLAWEEEIDQAITEIRAMPGSTSSGIIIRDRLQLMMYNIVYHMMFRRSFSGLDDPLYVELMKHNRDNHHLAQSFKYNYGDFVPSFKPFLRGYLKDVWTANQRRLAFLRDAFLNERRKQSGEKIGVDFFLDAHLKGEISESSVLYLVQNMNVAAIETTLWSTEWGVAELVNNPRIQRKIIDELDSVLGKGVPLTEPDLPRLPYLQAMVKEILRVHMVIPMLLPHMNLEPVKLAGYDIPAGCRVLVNAWGIANDPRYWDKPEVFNPDRFLDNKIDPNGNDFRFIPFGSGRRSCPGSMIALPVLGLVLGKLLQAFELLPHPGADKVDLRSVGGQLSLTIGKRSKVVVKPRSI